MAKMACSGSLARHFVNNDCVTAELVYSTAHARHEVLSWSGVVCSMHMCELHPESRGSYCCLWVSQETGELQYFC